ncbi:hypothetical protein Tco_1312174 [Tanacetum coccineum]
MALKNNCVNSFNKKENDNILEESWRKTLARRRASDKQGQDSSKRQKKEKETTDYEEEKDELRMWLTVVPDEEAIMDPEILHTKFPIVDWESQSLYNMHVGNGKISKITLQRIQFDVMGVEDTSRSRARYDI